MNNKWLVAILFITFSSSSLGEDRKLIDLFNDQVDAFNKKDIKRLVNNVSEDFIWFSITSNELLIETKDKASFKMAMENYYKNKNRNSFSKIEGYTIDGDRISFKEVVSHRNKKGELVESSAMGVYEMKNNRIFRAWYFVD
ncbi:MAG: hypothetical protein COA86_01370 [Kangiella sp.]|nr:MAG: hypothetical protein COA86_01370 [Kangiella sp.]